VEVVAAQGTWMLVVTSSDERTTMVTAMGEFGKLQRGRSMATLGEVGQPRRGIPDCRAGEPPVLLGEAGKLQGGDPPPTGGAWGWRAAAQG
jgi:hypothetical protein